MSLDDNAHVFVFWIGFISIFVFTVIQSPYLIAMSFSVSALYMLTLLVDNTQQLGNMAAEKKKREYTDD